MMNKEFIQFKSDVLKELSELIKIIQKKLLQMEDDLMTLTKEEMVFLRLIMRDAWYYCDVRNMDITDRNHFNSIQKKLSQELINA